MHLIEHLIQGDNNREQVLSEIRNDGIEDFLFEKKYRGSLSKIPSLSVISLTKKKCEYSSTLISVRLWNFKIFAMW